MHQGCRSSANGSFSSMRMSAFVCRGVRAQSMSLPGPSVWSAGACHNHAILRIECLQIETQQPSSDLPCWCNHVLLRLILISDLLDAGKPRLISKASEAEAGKNSTCRYWNMAAARASPNRCTAVSMTSLARYFSSRETTVKSTSRAGRVSA